MLKAYLTYQVSAPDECLRGCYLSGNTARLSKQNKLTWGF